MNLQQQLRDQAGTLHGFLYEPPDGIEPLEPATMREAADRIEALEAALREIKECYHREPAGSSLRSPFADAVRIAIRALGEAANDA